MTKSRAEKNKKLYEDLEKEMKNNKENQYEEKLNSIDPKLNKLDDEDNTKKYSVVNKKSENKNNNVLAVIAKEVNGKKVKKDELVVVKEEKKEKKKVEKAIVETEEFTDPISYTDKLSIEEILRLKIEQQQRLKKDKKNIKRSPVDSKYTSSMMQERIKQHEGVDVRKEVNIKTKDYKWAALGVLIISLIAVIIIGVLLIFRIIEL